MCFQSYDDICSRIWGQVEFSNRTQCSAWIWTRWSQSHGTETERWSERWVYIMGVCGWNNAERNFSEVRNKTVLQIARKATFKACGLMYNIIVACNDCNQYLCSFPSKLSSAVIQWTSFPALYANCLHCSLVYIQENMFIALSFLPSFTLFLCCLSFVIPSFLTFFFRRIYKIAKIK